uniref:GPI mannosyltransferase 2 n=1 Tax=Caenorhabditis japonica TaxID=281687 RepID=A0A8R1HY88_CAEJA
MVRHDARRERPMDRLAIEHETNVLEDEMVTYEEEAIDMNRDVAWNDLKVLFSVPEPNKIRELGAVGYRPFNPENCAFFRDRWHPSERENLAEQASEDVTEEDEDSDMHYECYSQNTTPINDENDSKEWKMMDCYWFVLKQLFWSRIWILILQFIAASFAGNRFKTDGFDLADKSISSGESLFGDVIVRKLLAGLRRWDAQHFLFVADHHYVIEQSLAFFPGYPEVINILRIGFQHYFKTNYDTDVPSWVLSGVLSVLINLFFFHLAGFALFLVTYMVTRSCKRSLLAVCLFAYNPASIFFTAAYSESMFMCLTMSGFSVMIFSVHTKFHYTRICGALAGTAIFGLSLVSRSNGLLNVIFVAWYFVGAIFWEPEKPIGEAKKLKEAISSTKNAVTRKDLQARSIEFEKKRHQKRKTFRWTDSRYSQCGLMILFLICASLAIFGFFLPYVFMANGVFSEFCHAEEHAKLLLRQLKKIIRIPSKWITIEDAWEKTTWCRDRPLFGFLPQYYKAIQYKYWDVRFFGYWQFKKIPCFLLMFPAAFYTFQAIIAAFDDVFNKRKWNNIWVLTGRTDHTLPMAIHAAILLFVGIFYMNAEVFTRMIFSSSPLLYIYLSGYLDEMTKGKTPGNRLWHYENSPGIFPFFIFRRVWNDGLRGKLFYIYFFSYFIFGTMAHAAWLPFT